jgi:hypothetical protein
MVTRLHAHFDHFSQGKLNKRILGGFSFQSSLWEKQ